MTVTQFWNGQGRPPPTVCLALLGILCAVLLAVFSDLIAPFRAQEVVGGIWEPAGPAFPLGTDHLGRDLFSELIHASRLTIAVALAASLLSMAAGIALHFALAVTGGWIDRLAAGMAALLLPVSTVTFVLVALANLPQNVFALTCVIAAVDQIRLFRPSRAIARDLLALEFVLAARRNSNSWLRIAWSEVLPGMWGPLAAALGLRFVFALLLLSALSFLGLGIQPPEADWASMVTDNRYGIVFLNPAALYPGGAIAALAFCVNRVAEWFLRRRGLAI